MSLPVVTTVSSIPSRLGPTGAMCSGATSTAGNHRVPVDPEKLCQSLRLGARLPSSPPPGASQRAPTPRLVRSLRCAPRKCRSPRCMPAAAGVRKLRADVPAAGSGLKVTEQFKVGGELIVVSHASGAQDELRQSRQQTACPQDAGRLGVT